MLFSLPEPSLAPLRPPARVSFLGHTSLALPHPPPLVPCAAAFSMPLLPTPLLATERLPCRPTVIPALAAPRLPRLLQDRADLPQEEEEEEEMEVDEQEVASAPTSPCFIPLAIETEPLAVPPRVFCPLDGNLRPEDPLPPSLPPLNDVPPPLVPVPIMDQLRLPTRCSLTVAPFASVPDAPVFTRDEAETQGSMDAPPRCELPALPMPARIRPPPSTPVDPLPVPVLPPSHRLPLLPRPKRIHAVSVRHVVQKARRLASVPHATATGMLFQWLALVREPPAARPDAPDHGRTMAALARLTAPQYTDADPSSLPAIFETMAQRARKLRSEAADSTVARQQLASTSTLLVLIQVRLDAVRGGVGWALERLRKLLARDDVDTLRLARRRLDAAVELLASFEAQHADVVHPRVVAIRHAARHADHVRVRCPSESEARALQAALRTDLPPAHPYIGTVYLESEYVAYLDAQARGRHQLENHVSEVKHAVQTSCRVLLHW